MIKNIGKGNCFKVTTKFLTDEGEKTFKNFADGDKVNVYDKDGVLREAIVHNYGQQSMHEIILENANGDKKRIQATEDHKWLLENGKFTSALEVNSKLYNNTGDPNLTWIVKGILLHNYGIVEDVWCVEEPVTGTFTLTDNVVTGNCVYEG